MKEKWNFSGRFANSDLMHYLRFAAIPLLAVILIAVIISSDRGKNKDGEAPEGTQMVMAGEEGQPDGTAAEEEGQAVGAVSGQEGQAGDGAAAGEEGQTNGAAAGEEGQAVDGVDTVEENRSGDGQPGDGSADGGDSSAETEAAQAYADIDISRYTLKQDEVPQLLALVRTYCQAKEDADPELLARLFGRSGLTEEEIAAEKERMELVKASVRSYENISCYSIEGPEPDTYVIFPYFEIRYRGAEMLMPQLTWAYVTRLEDGSYVMQEDVSEAVAAYIARIGEKEDVAALREQVADAMAEAVSSDEKLKSIYSGESEVVIGS